METEASLFETSEMLATFLASTPLLLESWKLCSHANTTAAQSFVVNRIGEVTYVAFSGVQMVSGLDPSCRNLVPLVHSAPDGLFSAFHRRADPDQPVMVHAGLLHLFLSNCPNFLNQMFEIRKKSKSVVFTGHSIGGTLASLSTLWLLSDLQSSSSSSLSAVSVLCITFGSPLLGNESLSRAILQERWGGSFCHVVAKHDIVPRLLLAPPQLQFWQYLSMTSPSPSPSPSPYMRMRELVQLPDNEKSELFHFVLAHTGDLVKAGEESAARRRNYNDYIYWPFGNYMFCTDEGAVCVDNAMAVVKLLHLMFAMGSASCSIEDHLKYEEYVGKLTDLQFSQRRGEVLPAESSSSYEAGITLALQSSGISTSSTSHEPVLSGAAKDCLKMAKRMGRAPNLNCANLAIGLSKIAPLRAQIEWYKALCDESDDHQMGYYDTFKLRGASRRDSKVNMNRIKLAQFWKDLIQMWENNQLPHDFHKKGKWVNTSQSYKLLVEPLDIAEYYRSGMHRTKGHYLKHGCREKRYEIFDRWWRDRSVGNGDEYNNQRSKFASLTQDTCFWAKVEEATEWLDSVRSENDASKLSLLWNNIVEFEQYARRLVERKEVSRDVVAKYSSYSLWVEAWTELKKQMHQFPLQFPG